jgi:hypothetical protein
MTQDNTDLHAVSAEATAPNGASAAAPAGSADAAEPAQAKPSLVRRVLTTLLIVLAALGVVLSVLTVWSHQVILNTDRFMDTVQPVASDPAVIDAASQRVGDQIVIALNIQQRAADVLPDRADFLAEPLANATTQFIQTRLETFLSRERVQTALLSAIRFAHERIVAFLRGESRNLQLSNGQVTLNLFPLIDAALRSLQDTRLGSRLLSNVSLPDLSNVTPEQGRAELSQALGVQLPDGFGEVQVADAPQLDRAEKVVSVFDTLVWVLPVVTLAIMAGAMALSTGRRRTLIQLAIASALAAILGYVLVKLLGQSVVSAVTAYPAGHAAARAAVTELVASLTKVTVALVAAFVLVAVVALFVGRDRDQERVRTGSWIGQHVDYLRVGGTIVALVALFAVDLSWASFITIVLLLLAYQVALSVIGRRQSSAAQPAT